MQQCAEGKRFSVVSSQFSVSSQRFNGKQCAPDSMMDPGLCAYQKSVIAGCCSRSPTGDMAFEDDSTVGQRAGVRGPP